MSKPALGATLGAVLGALDGLSALFYPEAAPMIVQIVAGSTIKGLLTGLLAGVFARRLRSLPLGIAFALAVGLALSFLAASVSDAEGRHHYFEIMLLPLRARGQVPHEQNVSTYPAQPKNPKGEVHEHWSFFSYDRARQALLFRQFHVEGFINQYVMSAPSQPGRLVFESEAFENVPAGWKARETYEVVSPDEFVETFELARGGEGYEVYSKARFKRVRRR